jgi:hypothetical protein
MPKPRAHLGRGFLFAGMTLYQFRLLIPRAQLLHALTTGTFLAQRWDDESGINLYHCADEGRGFFVEVGIDNGKGQAVVLRSFVNSGPLEDYAHRVRLPEE